MSSSKKPPLGLPDESECGVISGISVEEFMRLQLKLISEPGDVREYRVQAQVKFLRASSIASAGDQAGAGTPAAKKTSSLFSELIEDHKRDRLAANKWTRKTQNENLSVYKLCIDIIGDLPLCEIGEDDALAYVETRKGYRPTSTKCLRIEASQSAKSSH